MSICRRELARNHPGGSIDEILTVYTIVNALTDNLPAITAVQILIDGHEVDTLAGHVDLAASAPEESAVGGGGELRFAQCQVPSANC